MEEDLEEGTGESSSPPSCGGSGHGGNTIQAIRERIYQRLVDGGFEEDEGFRNRLDAHFDRFPASYTMDVHEERAEDVLLHQKILVECEDPEKRPVFHVRYLKSIPVLVDGSSDPQPSRLTSSASIENGDVDDGTHMSNLRDDDLNGNYEPLSRLEDLNLGKRQGVEDMDETGYQTEASSARRDTNILLIHEIIFSSIDKPKLLSKLSSLVSDIGLNIREAHVFSTFDGYCLDVFVVDGWLVEGTDDLREKLQEMAIKNASFSSSPHSSASEKILEMQEIVGDSEIDKRYLCMGEKIASGSSGDLYHGTYHGMEVAIKVLRTDHLNNPSEAEFLQEIMISRSVNHENVVRFYGACTKPPNYCIVTEYMPGGNLYDFLHKPHNILELPTILRIAIGVSKGMDYLHQNNIIHRDLKTANLLIGLDQVVKIADFGVARHQSDNGDMTAETGTYRWMAPEVINHKPYDCKADVFSFAIVLWELATSQVPYNKLTPLQAALGVRQGMRPEIPSNVHPRLSNLIRRCWNDNPLERPYFSDIAAELEDFIQQVQVTKGVGRKNRTKIPKTLPV